MAIRFGESATGEDSDELFGLLRQACLRRDGDAPVQLSPQEAQVIETYPEIQGARAALDDARAKFGRNAALTRRLATRLKYRIKTITAALLTEKREAYFRRADQLGAHGQGIDSEEEKSSQPNLAPVHFTTDMGGLGTKLMGDFLHTSKLGGERRTTRFMELLCQYVLHRFTNMGNLMCKVIAEATNTETTLTSRPAATFQRYKCLFGCPPLPTRTRPTDHVQACHSHSFTTPFECPEMISFLMQPECRVALITIPARIVCEC